MQHPTAFLTLRPHAEGRPEDAALEPFPLEERILVVLAQQPWASAANLAKRLDVSESDIHKACHELEENKKLIAGRDRLITELRLSGATTFEQARAVLKQFLPRFNRRFGVPAQCPEPVSRASVPSQCPEPAFRPLQVDLPLEQVLCFKHRRRVTRHNTVKYQRHTLQLLPDPKRLSYAGAVVVVLEGLDGRLSVQPEGRIIAAQEAPPSPGTLRKAEGTLPTAPILIPDPGLSSTASASALELLNSQAGPEDDYSAAVGDAAITELQVTTSPRKPTSLQRERWKAVQQAKLQGLSIRRMARELGIHRDTVRRYIDAESPPTRRPPIASTTSPSDTIADQPSDISAEHLDRHLS